MARRTTANLAEEVHPAAGERQHGRLKRRARHPGLERAPEEQALAGSHENQEDTGGAAEAERPGMGEGPGSGAPVGRRARSSVGGGEGTERRRVHRAAHQGPAEALGEGEEDGGEEPKTDGGAGR